MNYIPNKQVIEIIKRGDNRDWESLGSDHYRYVELTSNIKSMQTKTATLKEDVEILMDALMKLRNKNHGNFGPDEGIETNLIDIEVALSRITRLIPSLNRMAKEFKDPKPSDEDDLRLIWGHVNAIKEKKKCPS